MWHPNILVMGALAALFPGPVGDSAGNDAPSAGRRVITKYGVVLKVGGKVVDDGKRTLNQARGIDKAVFKVYRVEQADGKWLWLVPETGGPSGWVPSDSVLTVDQAIGHFTDEIRDDPRGAVHYVNRGLVWLETGENSIAIADFTEAIRLDPKNDVPYLNRGRAWSHEREYDKAIADFTEAIRLDPRDSATFQNRGAVWRDKKEYDKAIADLDEAIRLDPDAAGAYVNRAWCRAARQDYDKAWADFNEAIRLQPRDGFFYTNRAWFSATCPDDKYFNGKRAVATATRACELGGWKDAYNLGTLAAACAAAGDFDAAVKWQEEAQRYYDDDGDRREGLERLNLYKQKKPYRLAANH